MLKEQEKSAPHFSKLYLTEAILIFELYFWIQTGTIQVFRYVVSVMVSVSYLTQMQNSD